jgi:hypothetical protein
VFANFFNEVVALKSRANLNLKLKTTYKIETIAL